LSEREIRRGPRFCERCGRPLWPSNKGFYCPSCRLEIRESLVQSKLLVDW